MGKEKDIEIGLLELYAMGATNEEETRMVLERLSRDKVWQKAYEEIEAALICLSEEQAVPPPAHIRESIKHATNSASPAIGSETVRRLKVRLAVAASLAALFALGGMYYYQQWRTNNQALDALQIELSDKQERLNNLEEANQRLADRMDILSGENVTPVLLAASEMAPDARAIAYLDHEKKRVVVNAAALPELEAHETYQMWADVAGEMINMGLLPVSKDLVAMTYIENAESLNITIEPEGGSEHPTVSRLIANAYL